MSLGSNQATQALPNQVIRQSIDHDQQSQLQVYAQPTDGSLEMELNNGAQHLTQQIRETTNEQAVSAQVAGGEAGLASHIDSVGLTLPPETL